MKKIIGAGFGLIAGVLLAGAAMAHTDDVDVLVAGLMSDVGVYELSLVPDGADLLACSDFLTDLDVVQDNLSVAEIAAFQTASLTNHLATRGAAADSMVDDAMRLWRVRTIEAFTVSPDLLI